MNKRDLRKLMRAKRDSLGAVEIISAGERLCERLFETDEYRRAEAIYCYYSIGSEVPTEQIILRAFRDGKRVALPKVYGQTMCFMWITNLTDVESGYRNIPEPKDGCPFAHDERALVLVPGLAFDQRGYRIGYGGGFYDRFLQGKKKHPTVAIGYDFQLVERIENDAFDIAVDKVIIDSTD